jgi:hypothetical protein
MVRRPNRKSALLGIAAALGLASVAHGGFVTVPVAEDASVNAMNPDGVLNTFTTRGGLFSGLDAIGSDYQFFLKFHLPPATAGPLVSATLRGTYTDDFDELDSFHGIFLVPDDGWSESTVTFNTAPPPGAPSAAGFDAGTDEPGEAVSLDVTDVVAGEYAGDGTVSLKFSTIDGRLGDLEFFASKEFDPAKAFRLDLEIEDAAAVPLPPAAVAALPVVAVAMIRRYRRA